MDHRKIRTPLAAAEIGFEMPGGDDNVPTGRIRGDVFRCGINLFREVRSLRESCGRRKGGPQKGCVCLEQNL